MRNRVLMIILCVVLAGALTIMIATAARPATGSNLVSVVVAATDIPQGSKIGADQVALTTRRAEDLPAGTFTSVDMIVGQYAPGGFLQNEAITKTRVAAAYVPVLQPGQVLVTLYVSPNSGGEFLRSGDRVEVYGLIPQDAALVPKGGAGNLPIISPLPPTDQSGEGDTATATEGDGTGEVTPVQPAPVVNPSMMKPNIATLLFNNTASYKVKANSVVVLVPELYVYQAFNKEGTLLPKDTPPNTAMNTATALVFAVDRNTADVLLGMRDTPLVYVKTDR